MPTAADRERLRVALHRTLAGPGTSAPVRRSRRAQGPMGHARVEAAWGLLFPEDPGPVRHARRRGQAVRRSRWTLQGEGPRGGKVWVNEHGHEYHGPNPPDSGQGQEPGRAAEGGSARPPRGDPPPQARRGLLGRALDFFRRQFRPKPLAHLRTTLLGADRWQHRATAEEATAALQDLGVGSVELNGHHDVGNRVGMVLAALHAKGLPMPRAVRVDAAAFTRDNGMEQATAYFDRNAGAIVVNPHGPLLRPEVVAAEHRRGWLSSADPQHAVLHEYGHFLHHQNDPETFRKCNRSFAGFSGMAAPGLSTYDLQRDFGMGSADWWGSADGKVKGVSHYGKTATTEMVAEVFVGLCLGTKYSPKLLAAYRHVGGVVPDGEPAGGTAVPHRTRPVRHARLRRALLGALRVRRAKGQWDEAQHPRGQPDNPGQFAPKGGGGGKGKTPSSAKPRRGKTPATSAEPPWRQPVPAATTLFGKKAKWADPAHTGFNPIETVTVGGKTYFVKRPLNPADVATEHAANQVLHLLETPNIHSLAVVEDPETGEAVVVSPKVPGESLNAIRQRTDSKGGADWAEVARLLRTVPEGQLGAIGFANWFLNAGDRHANNYLFAEGHLYPIDYGYAFFPKHGGEAFRQEPEELLQTGQFDGNVFLQAGLEPGEVEALPVSRVMLERTLAAEDDLLRLLKEQVLPYYPRTGRYRRGLVLEAYRRKFRLMEKVLREQEEPLLWDFVGEEWA